MTLSILAISESITGCTASFALIIQQQQKQQQQKQQQQKEFKN